MRPRVFLAALPLLAACYTYAPIEPATARPGTGVRVRVSASGAERLAPLLGTSSGARLLSGTLVDVGPDTMIVQVPTVVHAAVGGSTVETLHQRVSIPRADLLELETRKLDRVRTGVLAGSAALIVGTVVVKSLTDDRGTDKPPGGNGGTEVRLPLLGLRF